jgi:AcrR family transcriptional regulator
MGRPREHDARTAAALLDAAERAVEAAGLTALSVRGVAEDVGTTTRAVYSLFGSKDGLLAALGARAFEMLGASVQALPASDDPVADLVEAGVAGFRRFAMGHPVLFMIGVQQTPASPEMARLVNTARVAALAGLLSKLTRMKDLNRIGHRTVSDAASEFHALCEGLAAMELRGALRSGDEERIWRDALTALAAGFGAPVTKSRQGHSLDRKRAS